jgi:hypothetical protein
MMFSTMRSVKAEIVKNGLTSRADRMIDPSATYSPLCTAWVSSRNTFPRWSRSFSGPFTDTGVHLLVRNNAALFDIALRLAHCSEKRDFVSSVTIIDVVRQSVDCLKDRLFNTHGPRLAKTEIIRNGEGRQIKVRDREDAIAGTPTFRLAAETDTPAACAPLSLHFAATA